MSTRQFASQLRALIEDVKAKGTAAIYCDNLIAYLREVENSPEPELTPLEIEKYKADLQNWIEENKSDQEVHLELFRSVIAAGQSAIKSSFLLNGGAAVALLAFIGHLAQLNPSAVARFGECMLPFTYGVLAIAVTAGLTYLSQWLYASPQANAVKAGFCVNLACIALGIGSYAFFVRGLLATAAELKRYS
jgi:hypothetical protein